MTDDQANPPAWDPGSDEPRDTPRRGAPGHSSSLVGASILFGLVGPGVLTLLAFPGLLAGAGSHDAPYPFSYPAWAFGVTVTKFVAMIRWLVLYCEDPLPSVRRNRLGAMLAGIFLVGGLHGVRCGISGAMALGESWWLDILVQVIWMSPLVYLLNFVLAVRWVFRRGGRPMPGFLIGVAIAVVPPALAEWLLCGLP